MSQAGDSSKPCVEIKDDDKQTILYQVDVIRKSADDAASFERATRETVALDKPIVVIED